MSDFAHVPIIRLEVTGMKHAIRFALSEPADTDASTPHFLAAT